MRAVIFVMLYITLYKLLLPKRYRRYLRRADGNVDKCNECLYHGTFYEEYDLYDFAHKSEAERRTYLTDTLRNRLCAKVNNRCQQAVVTDKYRTAKLCEESYKRPFMLVDGREDRRRFVRFCSSLGEVVVKPTDECAGRGVRLLREADAAGWERCFARLMAEKRRFIVEQRILQDPFTARWSSSVNTVRVNTFQHGGQVEIFTSFIRTGRGNAFVDNGAQGGLFASIDDSTGIIITDGFDERGNRYVAHPDSGIPYRGERLPRWDELRALAVRLAVRLPRVVYVGWDFALTPGGWVLMEANKGEFIAQQVTLGRGLRKEFEQKLGICEL